MSDYFFYDLNKKMADLAKKQQLAETAQATPVKPAPSALRTQLNERDLGKHNNATTGFAALAKKTGGGEKGARIAGAQLAKMRAKGQVEESKKECPPMSHIKKMCQDGKSLAEICKMHPDCDQTKLKQMVADCKKKLSEGSKPDFLDLDKDGNRKEPMKSAARGAKKDMDESAFQAAIGKKKYGDQGMKALQKAGRDNASAKTMSNIRNKYDKYDEGMTDEGNAFSGAVVNAKRDGIQPGEKVRVGGKEYPLREVDATPQHVDEPVSKPVRKASAPVYAPGDMDGATAPPAKGKDGRYPIVTSGPHKGKRWSPTTPGPTNPTMKETGGIPMTPKQQKFAKLAPPVNKITFADKIVGAKKEVDEMLGDVAANAMKKAVGSRGQSSYQRGQQQDDEFASDHFARARNQRRHDAEDEWARSKGRKPHADMDESFLDDEPTSRRSSTGGRIDTSEPGVTRHRAVKGNYSGAGHDAGADDEPSGQIGRRKVGAGMGKKIGAKINRGTSKLMTKEGDMPEDMIEPQDSGEYDQEGDMAKDTIKTVVRHAQALEKILGDDDNLPEWVQSKLAKIENMMTAVDDYMQNQKSGDTDDEKMSEESTNKRDSRAEKAGRKVAKDIEYDEKKKDGIHGKRRDSEDSKAERAGKKVTKDIEYDEKKDKKKEVDETTSSGSVATSAAAPKAGGGHNYGKGIYDSLNRQLENMISESMTVNMTMNNDDHGGPKKSLTVTATDEDAVMLAGLLKMAGMGQDDEHMHDMTDNDSQMLAIQTMGDEESCGSSPGGGDDQMMDEAYGDTDATENEPDYPTDEEGTDDAMMYSGGLNGPKSTGQTTIPVIAGQDDRMGYNGDHELRRMMEIAGIR